MRPTELEQLLSQGEYILPIHGYKRKDSMLQGEGSAPIVLSSIELLVHAPSSFSSHGPAGVIVRMSGPKTDYGLTNKGEKIIGAVYRRNEALNVSIAVTEGFLGNLGTFLNTIASAPCEISLTTDSKLEEWDGNGWLSILAFGLTTRFEKGVAPASSAVKRLLLGYCDRLLLAVNRRPLPTQSRHSPASPTLGNGLAPMSCLLFSIRRY